MKNRDITIHVKNKTDIESQKEEVVYKGAEAAMTVMIDEYSKELERKNILENKVVTMLTIQMAMLALLVPLIPFENIRSFFCEGTRMEFAITFVSVLILAVALVLMVISFGYLISAIKIQVYKKIDIALLCSDANMKRNKDLIEASLCIHYKDIIVQNEIQNNNKSKKFQIALPLLICSFVLLTISVIMIKLL